MTAAVARSRRSVAGSISFQEMSEQPLDADGNAYVTGTTFSNNLAVTSAVQPTYAGGGDTFVAKVGPSGAKVYVTYHGGNGFDSEPAITADAATRDTQIPVVALVWLPNLVFALASTALMAASMSPRLSSDS